MRCVANEWVASIASHVINVWWPEKLISILYSVGELIYKRKIRNAGRVKQFVLSGTTTFNRIGIAHWKFNQINMLTSECIRKKKCAAGPMNIYWIRHLKQMAGGLNVCNAAIAREIGWEWLYVLFAFPNRIFDFQFWSFAWLRVRTIGAMRISCRF